MDEQWLPVPGYEQFYEVSSLGRVRSLPRVDRIGRLRQSRLRRATPIGRYLCVTLTDESGRQKLRRVHQIVAEAFHGPRPPGTQVCHYDGNGHNNHADNLRFGSAADNGADKVRLNTHCRRGHEFTTENTNLVSCADGYVRRQCRTCNRERSAQWAARSRVR